jgi:hypothetical protein
VSSSACASASAFSALSSAAVSRFHSSLHSCTCRLSLSTSLLAVHALSTVLSTSSNSASSTVGGCTLPVGVAQCTATCTSHSPRGTRCPPVGAYSSEPSAFLRSADGLCPSRRCMTFLASSAACWASCASLLAAASAAAAWAAASSAFHVPCRDASSATETSALSVASTALAARAAACALSAVRRAS